MFYFFIFTAVET